MSKHSSPRAKAKRTTIALHPGVYAWALELMAAGNFNSFSDLVEDLIRRRKEEMDRLKAAKPGGRYPDPGEQSWVLEDKPADLPPDKIN